MAISKVMVASIFLSLMILSQVQAIREVSTNGESGTTTIGTKMDCGGACLARCKLSSRPNLCQRACGTCCARCNCVPPGTSGNYEACSCYAQMTTRNNQRKCP